MSNRTLKTTLHIYLVKYTWSGEYHIATRNYRPDDEPEVETTESGDVRIYLESRDIEVRAPSEEVLVNAQIDGLKAAIERERAESARRVAIMQERISSLLSLEAPAE